MSPPRRPAPLHSFQQFYGFTRLESGMLLLFRMRNGAIAKHCGIVTDGPQSGGRFIHGDERLGVIDEALSEAWLRRAVFAFHFPDG